MDSSESQQKELRKVLQDMKNGGEGCTICKFVWRFALVVLVLVALFVFFVKTNKSNLNEPLPPEKTPKITPQEWDQHILELGNIIHPNATGTKGSATSMSTQSPTQPQPTSPTTFIPSKK